MNIRRVEAEIMKELAAEGRDDAEMFNKTTATWKHEKPTFRPEVGHRGSDGYVRTEARGSSKGVKKYGWLDRGTRVRWAIMSGNWRSKTRPGYITSYRGAGRVLVAGKRRMRRPRPGIKAREFSPTIFKRRLPKFKKRMVAANRRGIGQLYA
jgi:hypothetical protein